MALLELQNVTKRFGGLRAVSRVSFSVDTGSTTFIVGPNGAGKTTLFNLVAGAAHPDEGSIVFDGADISQAPANRAARLGIGRTFQLVKPLRNLTVLENVMLGAFLRTPKPSAAAAHSREVLAYLRMDHLAGVTAGGLTLAMLKRLELARALATRPKLLLLDEVVAGLPTAEAIALAELIRQLPERGVAAVAGVEHVMQVVMSIAQRVVVLDHGTVIADGEPQSVVRQPAVIEAYLGTKYKELAR